MFKVHMKEEKKYYLNDNISLIKRHASLINNTNYTKSIFYEKMGIVFDNTKAYMDGYVGVKEDKIYKLTYPGYLGRYYAELIFNPKYPYYGYIYEVFLTVTLSDEPLNGSTLVFPNFRNYSSKAPPEYNNDIDFEKVGCRRMLIGLIDVCFKYGDLSRDQDEKLQRLLLEIM